MLVQVWFSSSDLGTGSGRIQPHRPARLWPRAQAAELLPELPSSLQPFLLPAPGVRGTQWLMHPHFRGPILNRNARES